MFERGSGLVVEITDGDSPATAATCSTTLRRLRSSGWPSSWRRSCAARRVAAWRSPPASSAPRMLEASASPRPTGATPLQRTPSSPSETPLYVGRAVAALAADPQVWKKSGGVYASWTLSDEYGFHDADGRRPHWGRFSRPGWTPAGPSWWSWPAWSSAPVAPTPTPPSGPTARSRRWTSGPSPRPRMARHPRERRGRRPRRPGRLRELGREPCRPRGRQRQPRVRDASAKRRDPRHVCGARLRCRR